MRVLIYAASITLIVVYVACSMAQELGVVALSTHQDLAIEKNLPGYPLVALDANDLYQPIPMNMEGRVLFSCDKCPKKYCQELACEVLRDYPSFSLRCKGEDKKEGL